VWKNSNVRKLGKSDHGQFYSGDSYIVLHTYKKGDALRWDVYFWLGENTTTDEAGTAAYKTVELDDVLGGAPIEHREVMGHESQSFLNLFQEPPIRILEGGIDSGFTHVEPEKYEPRLLHIKGKAKKVRVRQVPLKASSMNSGDIFILDLGKKVIQWNGGKSGAGEKGIAGKLTRAIDDERGSVDILVVEEGDEDAKELFDKLEGEAGDVGDADSAGKDEDVSTEKSLWKLSDASGDLKFEKVSEGTVKRDGLSSDDAFVFDTGAKVFAWIGKGASTDERKKALGYAQSYLEKEGRPLWIPIVRILEGGENEEFEAAFD